MKYIKIFLMALLIGLSSCTYDYNWPDMWVQPNLTLYNKINTIALVEDYGFEIASVETYIEMFDENGQSLTTIHYSSSQDTFSPPRKTSYFVVTTECYGWPKGTYDNKQEVCVIKSIPFYISDLNDTVIELTSSQVDTIEYLAIPYYQIYISSSLPLTKWAEDYGFELWGADYHYSLFDADGNLIRSKTSGSDPINCSSGQYIQYEVNAYYAATKMLYTVVFDKVAVDNIVKSSYSKDEPYMFTTDNKYTLTYLVERSYTFSISWSYSLIASIMDNYGYEVLDTKANINYIDKNGDIIGSSSYKSQSQITVNEETSYIQLSIDCYGRKSSEAFGSKELVCTVAFDKLSVESLASEGTHIFGANDHYTITYHVGAASNQRRR